jgi:uncharacterized protein YqjF (DUF2071 family)
MFVMTPPILAEAIDRIAPTRDPGGRAAMRQDWRHLLFLHWVVPVAALRPRVPPRLEIDTFEDKAYVGLVPFTMTGVRPVWAPPVRGLSSFHEVNVRTYVHHQGRDPGVWFFSLDAAHRIAVELGRRFWHLSYHHARIALNVAEPRTKASGPRIEYRSERRGAQPAGCRVVYEPIGAPEPARPGTLEHFLAERYILYCQRGPRLYSGQVHHEAYPLQPVRVEQLDESLLAANGLVRPDTPPLAHYASGVRVRIYPLRLVPDV